MQNTLLHPAQHAGRIFGSFVLALQFGIENAINYDKCHNKSGDDRLACLLDKATVNIGTLFSKQVEGRVSTEVSRMGHITSTCLVAQKRTLICRAPCHWTVQRLCSIMQLDIQLILMQAPLLCRLTRVWLTTQVSRACFTSATCSMIAVHISGCHQQALSLHFRVPRHVNV